MPVAWGELIGDGNFRVDRGAGIPIHYRKITSIYALVYINSIIADLCPEIQSQLRG